MQTGRLLGTLFFFFLFGCASGISQQAKSMVTYTGNFTELQKKPTLYKGETVLLGGRILELQAFADSSEITVLQLPLGSRDRPEQDGESQGRFLVRAERFLDPAVYRKGTLLTVVGRVDGHELRRIGDYRYVYPVVEAEEIKVWSREPRSPGGFHFGVGIGTFF